MINHANTNQEKASHYINIRKYRFQGKDYYHRQKGSFHNHKGISSSEMLNNHKIYVPSLKVSKFMKQKLKEMKVKIEKSIMSWRFQ